MEKKKRQYTQEFKKEAVEYSLSSKKQQKQLPGIWEYRPIT